MMELIKGKSLKWWIKTIAFFVLFVVVVFYSFIKMKDVFNGVQLQTKIDLTQSSIATITGKAKHATQLTLNGREIFIDKDGNFSEPVALPPGFSIMTISALDKFGKTSEKKFEVVYKENNQVAILIEP